MRIIQIMAGAMLVFSHQAFAQAPAKEVVVVDGQIAVNNLPETQTVNGTVSVDNLPDVQDVWIQGATDPIPILDVTPNTAIAPSDMLHLATTSIAPGNTENVVIITPSASLGGVMTVPDGRFLVVTAVTVFPTSFAAGSIEVQLLQNNAVRSFWVVPNSQPTMLSFGPGLLFPAGYSLRVQNRVTSVGNIRLSLYGYLTDQ